VVLALVVFLTVSLSIVLGYQLLSGYLDTDTTRVRQRLTDEFRPERSQPAASPLYKNLERMQLDSMAGFELDPEGARPAPPPRGWRGRLTLLLEQADLAWTPRHLLIAAPTLSLLGGGIATYCGGMLFGTALLVLGALAPFGYVHGRRRARREKYMKQLPSAFDLMARVIRAGQSVPQSLQAVADAFEDPLAGEFAKCLKQQHLGLRPEVTFQEMAERSCILEMRIFAMAMLIQRQTGGNLGDVLERLAGLVRARVKLRQQVRTLTAEGRLQGWTLVVLPFLVLGVMMVVNPAYVEVLFQHVWLLASTATAMAVGLLWIRAIVDIDR
jgi:tight adherence protein B